MLCWSTHTRLIISIPHVQEIRKNKHHNKHDNQLINGVEDHIPEHHPGYQWLVTTVGFVGKDVM